MAQFEQIPNCCGIMELGSIVDDASPEDSLMSFSWGEVAAHVIFSVTSNDTARHKKGHDLAKYIKDHGLGDVLVSKAKANPGHDGTLKAWLWTPNKNALKMLQKRLRIENPDRYGDDIYDPYYNNYYRRGY